MRKGKKGLWKEEERGGNEEEEKEEGGLVDYGQIWIGRSLEK